MNRLEYLLIGREFMTAQELEEAMRRVRAPRPPRFRYLDRPIILTDGQVLRWPMVSVPVGRNSRVVIRLRKGRRRCTACGHRHGPSRNNRGKVCCAPAGQVDGRWTTARCGCTAMTDLDGWPPPAELLGQPKASGAARHMLMGGKVECAWCGHAVDLDDPAEETNDAGWAARAREHRADCEWVTARGNEDRMFPLSQDDYCGPRDP